MTRWEYETGSPSVDTYGVQEPELRYLRRMGDAGWEAWARADRCNPPRFYFKRPKEKETP